MLEKIKPASKGQEELVRALTSDEYEIIGVFGPTGTGKSLLSCAYGIGSVMDGKYDRFILARPIVDVVTGRELTAVELGDLYYELVISYLRDIFSGIVDFSEIKSLVDKGKLVIADSHFLRGRTFDRSVIFLDDAQNIPPESACEILMRIGHNSKFIVAGDPVFQKDVPLEKDGASVLREVLMGERRAKVVDLGFKDVVRPGALRGIRLLIEIRMRKRKLDEKEQKVFDTIKAHAPDADVLTVLDLTEDKKKFELKSEHVPDALVIAKAGYLGRVIGRGGERIQAVEKELNMRLRCIEMDLNFIDLIGAIHPVPWVVNHIVDVDIAGPQLQVVIRRRGMGAFIGQRAIHVRFVDSVFRRLMGIGIRVKEYEGERRR
ncbi:MAG: PhoH family protein [Thermoprotei archaeon]|nr:MAG: PhoH family protein [Thermoprotei archaeon]RLF25276.1 MAG: PhoH family protein [Thermoprotei archaeon]